LSKVRFNAISDEDKSYIKIVHANKDLGWDERMSILMNKFGISERTVRKWIEKLGFSTYKEIENEEIRQGKLREYDPNKKYYIFTWAQNATPVHKPFWENILAYADHLNANIGVIQGRYQNPTSLWTQNMETSEWWDEPLRAYMDAGRHNIHTYLDVLSDVKIRPTAVNPLTGFESLGGGRSSIFGHPRVHLRSLPVLKGHQNKLLLTTGSCTIKNYTDTKAGKKAEFHHTYGFVIVEIKDDLTYYVRQVTAQDDGSFTDLIHNVKDGDITKVNSCAAYIMGDIHCANVHHPTMKTTVDKLFKSIEPRRVILHDIYDGESVNHHESKDPIKAYARFENGKDILKDEIQGLKDFIDHYDLTRFDPIVIRSNHDLWLEKWIKERDWRYDIRNAKEYMLYAYALLNGDAPKGLIPYILDEAYGDKITTLDEDDSFKVLGWELAHHGHLGAHGSKGNLEQFRKFNTKVVVGDYHQPGRKDGAVGVGTYSELRMGYNKGASSWMHAGVIIHNNGKAQHVIFSEDNEFTTLL